MRPTYHRSGEPAMKVLIVDDDSAMRKLLRRVLSALPSVEVTKEAKSGAEAITLLPTFKPDVVIMDAQMPVMDGVEATRQIKARFPHVVVVGLSGSEDHSMVEAGAVTTLLKGDATGPLIDLLERLAHGQD